MNVISIISILFSVYFSTHFIMDNDKEFIASFGYTHHTNSEGQPSKYDGDYYNYSLILYDDKTYLYTFQQGRLKPRYEKELGDWELSDEKLITNATGQQYTEFSGKEIMKGYKSRTVYLLINNRLCDEISDICLQHRKGLPAWKLFKEYK